MADTLDPLILDLLEWIGPKPRSYAEVLEVWRTSCPRLPVWEEALARGFLQRTHETGQGAMIQVSAVGAARLGERRTEPVTERTP